MAEKDWDALKAAIFSAQMDEDVEAVPNESQFMEQIRTGRTLSADERVFLRTSPLARDRYRLARYRVQREAERQWQAAGWSEPASALLAASGSTVIEVVEGPDFKVQIYSDSLETYLVTLLVMPERMDWLRSNPEFELQLEDTGGAAWLHGRPNAEGEITADWPFAGVVPRSRLNRYQLKLKPVLTTP